jgi:hypothetical protein
MLNKKIINMVKNKLVDNDFTKMMKYIFIFFENNYFFQLKHK